jgi:hypothetical protein
MQTVLNELKVLSYVRLTVAAEATTSSKLFYTCVAVAREPAFAAVKIRAAAETHLCTLKKVEVIAAIQLSQAAVVELDAALSLLHPADVCDWEWPLPFGVYAHDVLALDRGRPRLVHNAVARTIANAAITLAATSSRLFPHTE